MQQERCVDPGARHGLALSKVRLPEGRAKSCSKEENRDCPGDLN